MKLSTLLKAVSAGQILLLANGLTFERNGKEVGKHLSRVRMGLDNLLLMATMGYASADLKIAHLHDELVKVLGQHVSMALLVERTNHRSAGYGAYSSLPWHGAAAVLRQISVPERLNGSVTDADAKSKAFASLIRNHSWVDTLRAFGLPISNNKLLQAVYSSRMGRDLVADRIAVLGAKEVGLAKKLKAKFTPEVEIRVNISEASLWTHKVVTELLQGGVAPGSAEEVAVVAAIAAAAAPVVVVVSPPGPSVTDIPAAINATVAATLKKFEDTIGVVEKSVKKIRDAKAKVDVAAQEAKAIEALKAMGPLLKFIADNPGLVAAAVGTPVAPKKAPAKPRAKKA